MMLPWPLIHLLMPDLIGAGLLERVPSSGRCSQARISVFSMGPHHQTVPGSPGGTGSPCLGGCAYVQQHAEPSSATAALSCLHPGVRSLSSGLLIHSAFSQL